MRVAVRTCLSFVAAITCLAIITLEKERERDAAIPVDLLSFSSYSRCGAEDTDLQSAFPRPGTRIQSGNQAAHLRLTICSPELAITSADR